MDKDFMLNYYDKMVRPIWTELMKTPRYQRAACERDKLNVSSGGCWMKNWGGNILNWTMHFSG